ncbi:recombinase family protein [Bengtsoniella intestinalis]|uniref:recombinase family protein n=1 Tax=Bengtsoniella intestinalis TaxID=3073143 RepID=UPI00391F8023
MPNGAYSTTQLRRVAIYGRVSTQHEAQLSAFENQQQWYEQLVEQHPDWLVVDRYYDEGITGTATKKRPAFTRMMEDAKKGLFTLVVTREVCRFARNTIDALSATRELTALGVAVFFVQDNIWTSDGISPESSDGELRLSLMATLAQDESRKISQRVRAGQEMSRKNKVLYGNGNILGYDRQGKSYAINPQQAYIVEKVFTLYASGIGYKGICSELTRLGCKNAHDEVNWKVERIGRILRNATYMGYIVYNKSHSNGFLTQKRVTHREKEFVYIKGEFPPIVSEELWHQCERIRKKRSVAHCDENGEGRKFGRKEPLSVWSTKLRCQCGSAFRKFLWHKNADGIKTYGYECYRKKREVSAQYLEAHGLDTTAACKRKSIPYWHIDLMARMVFLSVWKERKDSVLLACQMIETCAVQDEEKSKTYQDELKQKMEQLKKSQKGLRKMCSDGDITREEFREDNQAINDDLVALQLQLDEIAQQANQPISPAFDLTAIRKTLDQWVDLSATVIPDAVIDQFVLQVLAVDDNTYHWTMNLTQKANPITPENKPQPIETLVITKEDAAAYCKTIGMKFFGKKWVDKTAVICI